MSIYSDIKAERERQDEKWGTVANLTHSPEYWLTILGEEFGEVAHSILNEDAVQMRAELIQLAAIALSWIEFIDKHE